MPSTGGLSQSVRVPSTAGFASFVRVRWIAFPVGLRLIGGGGRDPSRPYGCPRRVASPNPCGCPRRPALPVRTFVRARFIAPPFSALRRLLGGHILAPVAQPRQLLDVGTGTGIWAFEMQALFPHALIVGVDVSLASLPQPVPPTCLFVRANVSEGLPFPAVVRELVRVTRPGGWIERVEARWSR
jgi:hypothetical protein